MSVHTLDKPRSPEARPGEPRPDARPPTTAPAAPAVASPPAPPPLEPAPRPRRHGWLVWLIVALVIGGATWLIVPRLTSANKPGAAGQGRPTGPMPVVAATARVSDLPLYLEGLLGNVTPLNTATVRTRVDGQVMNVAFNEGQFVKEGDLLAQIDPRPFEVQLAQAQGQLAKDEATLKNAELDLQRYQAAGNAVTQQQIDTQQALVDQQKGIVESDRAQVDSAKLNLTYCKVTAPLSGRIGLRIVDRGNIVHASDQTGIAVITQLQPITVVFGVAQDQIPRILQNGKGGVGLPVDAYSSNGNAQLGSGAVEALDNQVDPTTGMVRVKATFANQSGALFPNQFVNARLLVNTLRNVVLVPNAAVQRGPDDLTYVYVVKPDETVEVRKVTLGPTGGDQTAVQSGLKAGEVVVTDGVDKLQDGSKVAVREARAPTTQTAAGSTTRPADAAAGAQGAAAGAPGAAGGRHRRPSGDAAADGAPQAPAPAATQGAGE